MRSDLLQGISSQTRQAGNGILYIQEVLNMHAWEQIQESIEFIESHLGEGTQYPDLAEKQRCRLLLSEAVQASGKKAGRGIYQVAPDGKSNGGPAFKGQKDFGHSGGAGVFLPRTFQQNL